MSVTNDTSSSTVSRSTIRLQEQVIRACENGDATELKELISNGADVNERMPFQLPLHAAVLNGNLGILKILIENNVHVNSRDFSGDTPLSSAVELDKRDLVKLLIENGADANIKNRHGYTPLSSFVQLGETDLVKLLLENGADVNIKNGSGDTPLSSAVKLDKRDLVKVLIENGADANIKNRNGDTPLSSAVKLDKRDLVKLLIENGVDVNIQNRDDDSPLNTAVQLDKSDLVKQLIESGADVNIKNKSGETPLSSAVKLDKRDLVKLLIENGADVNIKNIHGYTPLSSFVQLGETDLVKLLLENGANVNIKNGSGDTPLSSAVKLDKRDLVKLLIENGAHTNIKNRNGDTPLSSAVKLDKRDLVKLLIENGVDVNIQNRGDDSPLNTAVQLDKSDLVKQLIESGADVNIKNKSGDTPLSSAVKLDKKDLVKLLIENGADVNIKNIDDDSPLNTAVQLDKSDLVKLLIESGADVNIKNKSGETLLSSAVKLDKRDLVKLLIENGADVNIKNIHGYTPLSSFVQLGETELVKLLLENGANINIKNGSGDTPLSSAVELDKRDLVKLLIENGANAKIKNRNGDTPLSSAVKLDKRDLVKLLIENGVDVNIQNRDDDSPLNTAVQLDKSDLVKLLAEGGADVNIKNKSGDTLLSSAVKLDKRDLVKLLIENGADVNIKNKSGETPLSSAVKLDKRGLVKLLIENGADVNIKDIHGYTPLSSFVQLGETDLVKLLLENGANVNIKNGSGETPLSSAVKLDKRGLVKLLIENGADVNIKDISGDTPLSSAVKLDKRDLVKLLIENGADVNIKNIDDDSPLNTAVQLDKSDLVKLLAEGGADVNIKNKIGNTPLIYAVHLGKGDLVKLLIENGADVNIKNVFGETVSDLAYGEMKAVLKQLVYETEKTIPKEIRQLGKEAVKLYFRAKAKGSFSSNLIRCMFVGHFGAGKTTLVRHLLGLKRIKTSSTDGIDVFLGKCYHNTQMNEWIVQETHTEILSGVKDIIQIDIWDFAGQQIFYTTHQTYLSRRSLYFLVFNLALGLQDEVQDEDLDPLQNNRKRVIDFLEYWIGSIRLYANSDQKGFPRIIIVGTHIDKVCSSAHIRGIKDEISEKFEKNLESGELIMREDLFLNAFDMSKRTISLLRDVILTEGQKYPEYGEEIPSSWMELHKTIFREKQGGEKIVSLERIKQYNRELQTPLKENELKVFLLYLHEVGYILYFDVDTLRDFVILTPRWTIDAMKCLVTCPMFALSSWNKQAWETMRSSGKVHRRHIENVWKKKGNEVFYKHRQHLLLTMEKLDLICRPKVYDRNGNDVKSEHFYIPCMLEGSSSLKGESFRADEGSVELSYIFQDILPPAVFNRLLSACITLWRIHKGHLYHALAVFRCGGFHFLAFRREFKRITVSIQRVKSNDEIDRNLCMVVDTFVSQTIDGILSTFCTSSAECKPYTIEYNDVAKFNNLHTQEQEESTDLETTICPDECKGLDNAEAEIEIKDCQLMRIGKLWKRKELTLLSADLLGDARVLDDIKGEYADFRPSDFCFIMLHEWKRRLELSGKRVTTGDLEMTCTNIGYDTHDLCKILRRKDRTVSFLSPAFQMKEVSAELLDALADRISTTYLELGLELGLDFEEIKQFRMNNRDSTKKIVREMLRAWRERNKSEATVLKLATALVGTQSNITSLIETEDRGIDLGQENEEEVMTSRRCHIQ